MQLTKAAWQAVAGALLTVVLLGSGLVALIADYASATHAHIEVEYGQESLQLPAELQFRVSCASVGALPKPLSGGSIDLGWLGKREFVTVQVLMGLEGPHLDYRIINSGRVVAHYGKPEERNPTGLGAGKRAGDWILHRTYFASGQELFVHSHRHLLRPGCGVQPSLPADLKPTEWVRPGSFEATVFTQATAMKPIIYYFYLGLGLLLILIFMLRNTYEGAKGGSRAKVLISVGAGVTGAYSIAEAPHTGPINTGVVVFAILACVVTALYWSWPTLAGISARIRGWIAWLRDDGADQHPASDQDNPNAGTTARDFVRTHNVQSAPPGSRSGRTSQQRHRARRRDASKDK